MFQTTRTRSSLDSGKSFSDLVQEQRSYCDSLLSRHTPQSAQSGQSQFSHQSQQSSQSQRSNSQSQRSNSRTPLLEVVVAEDNLEESSPVAVTFDERLSPGVG